MIEILSVIALIGVISALGIVVYPNTVKSTKSTKLQNNVGSLNTAVQSYLAFNGDLEEVTDPKEVIQRLKSVASDPSKGRMLGLTGSYIDARVTLEMQSETEALTNEPRVYWNPDTYRFFSANSGPPGIREITFDASPEELDREAEDRITNLEVADNGGWIWNYTDESDEFSISHNTPIELNNQFPGTELGSSAFIPYPRHSLSPPEFSTPSGAFTPEYFDLPVSLKDTNPSGAAKILYRLGDASWQTYTGAAVSVPPNSIVNALAVPVDPSKWTASDTVYETYEVIPVKLNPPYLFTTAREFYPMKTESIFTVLLNTNSSAVSRLEYSLNGSDWLRYDNYFPLTLAEFPDGVEIRARAVATQEYYYNSDESSRVLGAVYPPTFYDIPIDLDTVFLIDVSNSMGGIDYTETERRIDLVRNELIQTISELDTSVRIGVVAFHHGAWVLPQAMNQQGNVLGHATDGTKQFVINELNMLSPGGATNYGPPLSLATQFDVLPEQVVLLTDGMAGDVFDSELTNLATLGIPIHSVALGYSAAVLEAWPFLNDHKAQLETMAQRTGGSTKFVNF
ncbi:MAG: vWA domain-containing protein [Verrucomicrobiota bacterium]